jgi:hypothetical protein
MIRASLQGSTDRVIGVVIHHKIRMTAGTVDPVCDLLSVLCESDADRLLGCGAIRPGGCRGNVPLMPQPVAKFFVAAPHMLTKGMASRGFVLGEIPSGCGSGMRLIRRGG